MGTFVFRWPHPNANDVHVTGTFDDWGKTEKLEQVGDVWEKEVELASADEKILYKFVVDDQWVIDQTAPQEDDGNYNVNNVLYPDQIKKKETSTTAGTTSESADPTISSAAPTSTTSEMAGKVPIESQSGDVPGAFPETPAQEQDSYGVAPIPASQGTGNPISLKPGEPIPSQNTITPQTVNSTVTTSQEDYEKAGSAALPLIGGAAAGAGVGALAGSAFSKGEDKKNLIPESSLPMGSGPSDSADVGPTISSAAPTSTTAGLAGAVPLEEKRQATVVGSNVDSSVPSAVKESISESNESPEAASSAEAVKEKSAVEKELLSKTAVAEGTPEGAGAKEAAGQQSYYGLATAVPSTVEESMVKAHASPEAAAEPSVVAEKTALEKELLSKVPSTDASGEPAPTISAATSATAPSAAAAGKTVTGSSEKKVAETSSATPAVVSGGADGGVSTPTPEVSETSVPKEKAAADTTGSAPAKSTGTTTGVASSAAAATSDGAADSSLAEEPAVKMMNQNETKSKAPVSAPTATGVSKSTPATGTTTSTTTTPAKKATTDASKAAAAATSGTAPSATSTPTKKPISTPESSPASSSTKEKKKKHRISSWIKKVFD